MSAPSTWEQVRDVALLEAFSPLHNPSAPRELLAKADLAEARKRGATDPTVIATMQHHRRCADVMQRNRSAFAAVLWACSEWKRKLDNPPDDHQAVGAHLLRRLREWNVPPEARVPDDWSSRRTWVEAWGTGRWWSVVMPERGRDGGA